MIYILQIHFILFFSSFTVMLCNQKREKEKKKLFHRNQKQKESPHFFCVPVKKILIGDAAGSGLANGQVCHHVCRGGTEGHGTHR